MKRQPNRLLKNMISDDRFIFGVLLSIFLAIAMGGAAGAVPFYPDPVDELDCPSCDQTGYRHAGEVGWTTTYDGGFNISFGLEDRYEFYVVEDGERFPADGSMTVILTEGNEILHNSSLGLITTSSQGSYFCDPFAGDFQCGMTYMQGFQALRFMDGYELTGNSTYLNYSKDYIFSDYGAESTCNPHSGDYNCSYNQQGFLLRRKNATGPQTQAIMIDILWRLYRSGGDPSFRSIALNYTHGHPDGCDVWSGDHDCGNARDQGYMISAFQRAYQVSGNETYMDIADQLVEVALQESYSHPMILKGFAMHGMNVSVLRDIAGQVEDDCDEGCTTLETWEYVTSFIEAYRATGILSFLSDAKYPLLVEPIEAGCRPLEGSYICMDEEKQSTMAVAFADAFRSVGSEDRIFNLRSEGPMMPEENLTIMFDWKGILENQTIHYSFNHGGWFNSSLQDNEFMFNSSFLNSVGVLSLYMTAGDYRYPATGTSNYFVNLMDESSYSKYSRITGSDPRTFCDPLGSDPRLNNRSCKYEHFQAWLINGMSLGSSITGNSTYAAVGSILADSPVDPSARYATCDHHYDDYDCQDEGMIAIPEINPLGAERQGSMAYSYLSMYETTGEPSYMDKAVNYLLGEAEGCDVWASDYLCSDAESQAYMILAYSKAHELIGNRVYLDIARELSLAADTFNSTELLLYALWQYEYLEPDQDVDDYLEQGMQEHGSLCIEEACAVRPFALNLMLYWQAYRYTLNETYKAQAFNKYLRQPDPTKEYGQGAQYYDCSLREYDIDFQCRTPEKQGMMQNALGMHLRTYIKSNYSLNITVHASQEVDFGKVFNATIEFTNTDEINLNDVRVTLDPSAFNIQGLNISNSTDYLLDADNHSVTYATVPAGSSVNTTWSLNASAGGPHTIIATASTGSAYESHSSLVQVTNIGETAFMQQPPPIWSQRFSLINLSYLVDNPYDFIITNLTVCFDPINISPVDYFDITNISADVDNITGNCIFQEQLNTQMMEGGDNFTAELDIWTGEAGKKDLDISIQSRWGAYQNLTQEFYIYRSLVGESHSYPETHTLKTPFEITFNLSNDEAFNMSDVSLFLNISEAFSISDIEYVVANDTTVDVSADMRTLNLSTFVSGYDGAQYVTWTVNPLLVGDHNISVDFTTPYVQRDISMGSVEIISNDVFTISYDMPLLLEGSFQDQGFWVDITNNLNATINDVMLVFNHSSGINITNISLDYTGYDDTVISPSGEHGYNISRIIYADNISINLSSWNASFNLSGVPGSHESLKVLYDMNITPSNMSCWYDSKESVMNSTVIDGTIDGSPDMGINLSENRTYDINFTGPAPDQLRIYWNYMLQTDNISGHSGNATILYPNGTQVCSFSFMDSLEEGDGSLQCDVPAGGHLDFLLNISMTGEESHTFDVNFTARSNRSYTVSSTRTGAVSGSGGLMTCELPVDGSILEIRTDAGREVTTDRMYALLNSSFRVESNGTVAGDSVSLGNMSPFRQERITGSFDVMTSRAEEWILVNLTSAEGANYLIDHIVRHEISSGSSSGGGGGGGGALDVPSEEEDDSGFVIIEYDYSEYDLTASLEQHTGLYPLLDLSNNATYEDLVNYTSSMIGCFSGIRKVFDNRSTLTIFYDCNQSFDYQIYDFGFDPQMLEIENNITHRETGSGFLMNISNVTPILIIEYQGRNQNFERPLILVHHPGFPFPPVTDVTEENETVEERIVYDRIAITSQKIWRNIKNFVDEVMQNIPFLPVILLAIAAYLSYLVYRKRLVPNTIDWITKWSRRIVKGVIHVMVDLYSDLVNNYYYMIYLFRNAVKHRPHVHIDHPDEKHERSQDIFFEALSLTRRLDEGEDPDRILEEVQRCRQYAESGPVIGMLTSLEMKARKEKYEALQRSHHHVKKEKSDKLMAKSHEDMPHASILRRSLDPDDIFFRMEEIEYDLNQGNTEDAKKSFDDLAGRLSHDPEMFKHMTEEDYYMLMSLYQDIRSKLKV